MRFALLGWFAGRYNRGMSKDETTAPTGQGIPNPDETRASTAPPEDQDIGQPHLAVLLATNKNFQSAAIMGIMSIAFDCCMQAATSAATAVEITPNARIREFGLDEGFGVANQSAANRISVARRLSGNVERAGSFVDLAEPQLAEKFAGASIVLVFDEYEKRLAEDINPIATLLAKREILGPAVILAADVAKAEAWTAERRGSGA